MRLLVLLRLLSATSRPSRVWWITRRLGNTCGGGRGEGRSQEEGCAALELQEAPPKHVFEALAAET